MRPTTFKKEVILTKLLGYASIDAYGKMVNGGAVWLFLSLGLLWISVVFARHHALPSRHGCSVLRTVSDTIQPRPHRRPVGGGPV